MPTYGLAENGLAVTIPPCGRGPLYEDIDREPSGRDRDRSPETRTRTFVSVGRPVAGTDIAVVDDQHRPLAVRQTGEVLVRSPSLMAGYFADPQATSDVLSDGWLRTGDLGYLSEGELYLVGRKKELLIVGGRKYHPGELEEVAAGIEGVFRRRVVAISFDAPDRATEEVAIMAETKVTDAEARDELRRRIRRALVASGYPVNDIVLLQPRTIEATPNGKLKRAGCRHRYLAGEFSRG